MPWTFEGVDPNFGKNAPEYAPDDTEQKSIGLTGNVIAGAASTQTWPMDLYKSLVRAHAIDSLKEGGEYTPEAEEAVEKAISYIPTQEALEGYLERKTGRKFAPQTSGERTARTVGQFIDPRNLVKQGAKGLASLATKEGLKKAGKQSLATIGAGLATSGLEEVGVPAPIAGLAGAAIHATPDVRRTMSKAAKESIETADKYGIQKYNFMHRKKPYIKGSISTDRLQDINADIQESIKKSVKDIAHKGNSAIALQKEGQDAKRISDMLLDKTAAVAKSSKDNIDIRQFRTNIENKIKSLKKDISVLSPATEAEIKELGKAYNAFSKSDHMSPEAHLDQYREFNKARKSLYDVTTNAEIKNSVKKAYDYLATEMKDAAVKSGPKEYGELFAQSNKLYNDRMKVEEIADMFQPFFEDPTSKNLLKVIKKESNKRDLTRIAGKDAVDDIYKIGKYQKEVEKRLKDSFTSHDKSLGQLMHDLGKLAIVVAAPVKGGVAVGALGGAQYLKGLALSSKTIRGDIIALDRAIASGAKKAATYAATKLKKDFTEEFGDPEEIDEE